MVETQRHLLATNGKAPDTEWEPRLIKNMDVKKNMIYIIKPVVGKVFLKYPIAKLK